MVKRLLFVFAHPDDESFACGGTIAKYADAGHEVVLVTATSGNRGRCGPFVLATPEEIAAHRERELMAAARILGITEVRLFRYDDGELYRIPRGELAARIEAELARFRPDVVVTFPPDGVTGHPDHIAVSRAADQAVAGCRVHVVPRFCFVSIPHYYDHCEEAGPPPACPITSRVDIAAYRERKGRALQAHASQAYSVNRAYPGVMQGDFRVIGRYEYYTLVRQDGRPVPLDPPADEIPVVELV